MKQHKWTILLISLLMFALTACNTGGTIIDTEPAQNETTPETETGDSETAEPVTDEATTSGENNVNEEANLTLTDGSSWLLETYPDANGTAVTVLPDSSITLNLAEGGINGNGSCNNYFGSYTIDGNNITFGPIGSTEMFCEATSEQESAYLATLARVSQYRIENGKLVLADEAGNPLLTYANAAEPTAVPLTDTVWLLNSYTVGNDAVTSVINGSRLTLLFGPDGALSGHAGCNGFGGSYTVDGDKVSIGEIASTLMACADDALMQQETAYHAALQTVASYQIEGDTLQLLDANGNLVLAFIAEPAKELAGTSWQVTSINNGNEAVTSLIADTAVTADFAINGLLSGSAGCNNYSTTYTINGDGITIQPAGVTKMYCENPEGLMAQEAQFLAALETAVSYHIDGDQMQLRTGTGAIALTLQLVNPEVGP